MAKELKAGELQRIVVFDGECAMCNRFATRSIEMLREATTGFVASGSEAGRHILSTLGEEPDPSSILLIEEGRVTRRSDAVIELVARFRKPYRYARVFRWIPRALRDGVYDMVASIRRHLPIKFRSACALSPERGHLLIDALDERESEVNNLLRHGTL